MNSRKSLAVIDNRMLDLRQLDRVSFDEQCATFHVDWENTLLMARLNADETLIVNRDGKILHVFQRYSDLICQVATEYHISRNAMLALYKAIKASPIGCVSGNHRLVPLTGLRNQNAIFIVADHLDNQGFDGYSNDSAVILTFLGYDHQVFRVLINIAKKVVERNLEASAEVSARLMNCMELERDNYELGRLSERNINHGQLNLRHEQARQTQTTIVKNALAMAFQRCFKKEVPDKFLQTFAKVLTAPYDGNNH